MAGLVLRPGSTIMTWIEEYAQSRERVCILGLLRGRLALNPLRSEAGLTLE